MVVVKSTGCHRLKVLLLFDIVGQVLEGNPSFVYTTTITITIMSVKIMIVFILRGTYGNPVFVRAHWRRRNGRKVFVRGYWRCR